MNVSVIWYLWAIGPSVTTPAERGSKQVEIYKFVAQFVRRFDFEFVNKEKPWEVSSMWSHNPVNMHMRLREQKL